MIKRPNRGTKMWAIYIELAVRKKMGVGRRHIIDGMAEQFNVPRGMIWDVWRRYIKSRDVKELA